jgi:hypothetical protein
MRTKILLSFAIFFSIAFTSNAQIDKGRIFLGGSIYYSNSNSKYNPPPYNSDLNESFGTNIQFGKVVKLNTVEGIIVSYTHSNYHVSGFPDSNFNRGNQISAGVFYRKYKRLLKDFYFFGEVDGVYFHSKYEQGNYPYGGYNSTSITNGGSVSFIPGLSYAVCRKMNIELLMSNLLSVSYSHSNTNYTQGTPQVSTNGKGNSFSIAGNLSSGVLSNFGIGFKFLLGK